MLDFIEGLPEQILVVVDEAYFEYASDFVPGGNEANGKAYPDASLWLERFPNLIVTRTFSKAYGLAALRVGYALSHPDVCNLLNRVRQPFNVNSLALTAATVALEDEEHLSQVIDLNRREMTRVCEALTGMGLTYIPSVGNFVSLNVGSEPQAVYDALLHEGVIVRPVANYGMPGYLRLTLGLEAENDRFLIALDKVLN